MLGGCSSTQVNESDPASLMQEAEEEIAGDHFQIALEKLRSIKNKFPYSKYSVEAQLRIADVYFTQELFLEAAGSYETFRDLHPKNEKAAYAMFRIGKSYFNDAPRNIARDLTSAHKGIDAYSDFTKKFPADPNVVEARDNIEVLRSLLADKELSIGDFYFKHDYYESAKPRYKKVIDLYPETEAARKAQEKLPLIESKVTTEGSEHYGRKDGRGSIP